MPGYQGPPQGRNPLQGQDAHGGQNQVNIQSGRNTSIRRGAVVAGRDAHVGDVVAGDKITIVQKARQWAIANPLLAGGVAVVVLSGSIWTGVSLGSDSGVDTSVVNEPGLSGALHTVEQIRVAERLADAPSWCMLTQPGDSTCETTMTSSFATKAPSYRDRVDQVGIGAPETNGTGAQVMLSWQGRKQGTVRLVQSGGRWQLNSTDYGLLKLCGAGVFLSLVDARSQELKCGMFQIPTT
ncbi:hypothetical protein AB0D86_40940 [Streptomyces sp. NPDC048324]|uniref:hypothetical protein n=1 Tax=Streptomyces sp. NPDC048324 TaxID=3157205 RepID=UPI00341E2595